MTLEEASLIDGLPGTYEVWIKPISAYDRASEQSARAADEEDREEGKQLHRLRRPVLDARRPRYG